MLMVKKQFGRREIIRVVGFIVLMTIVIFAVVAFLVTRGSYAPSVPSNNSDGKATVRGEAVCLPHKNSDGPQTLECAIGVKTDEGIYYSLSDTSKSYTNIATIQTGSKYEITGNIEERSDPKYATAGSIRVEKLRQL